MARPATKLLNQPALLLRMMIALALTSSCAPPPSAAPAAQSPNDAAWTAMAEAAKSEGRVVVKGNPTQGVRMEMPIVFKERFGIEIDYIGSTSSEFAVQAEKERAAGVYSVDIILGGAAVMYPTIYGNGWLDPLAPILTHPSVVDTSKWPGGKLDFMDPEQQYVLRIANSITHSIYINTDYIKPDEIKSWNDLLKPIYRGKLATQDAEAQGGGHLIATTVYYKLGEEFFRKLYLDQKPISIRDGRQLADSLGRGVTPIALGVGEDEFARLKADGFPVEVVRSLPEIPPLTSAGFAMMGLMNNAPHPKAAKLFANWLASKEGMEFFGKAAQVVPVRLDADKSSFPQYLVPIPGTDYLDTYDYDFAMNQRLPLSNKVRELLRS